jgi:hypothetical protein
LDRLELKGLSEGSLIHSQKGIPVFLKAAGRVLEKNRLAKHRHGLKYGFQVPTPP